MSRTFHSRLLETATEQTAIGTSLERAVRTAERAQQQIRRAQLQVLKADAVIRGLRTHLRRHGLLNTRLSIRGGATTRDDR